ncbi:MAG: nucleotidyltransferase domain-containing protein [Candidatus Diapherotrites archaeon]
MDALLKRVIAKVKPGKREIEQEMKLFRGIKGKIESVAGQHTRVLLAGSIARNTHLKGDRDIDIFVLFPQEMPREDFEREGIAIGKKVFRGQKW